MEYFMNPEPITHIEFLEMVDPKHPRAVIMRLALSLIKPTPKPYEPFIYPSRLLQLWRRVDLHPPLLLSLARRRFHSYHA